MKRMILLLTVLASVCILFSSCSSSGPYRATGRAPGEENPEDETVVYTHEKLRDLLKVLGQKAERKPDGRLAVYANLQNLDDEEIQIRVQADFKDQDGMSTGDTTNWEIIVLPAYATVTYKQISLNNKAYKYTIRVGLAEE